MRESGFFVTPPDEAQCALHVPCQGSMWTRLGVRGVMKSGAAFDSSTYSHARNFAAPWGWAVGNFKNTYSPRLRMTPSTPLQMTFMLAPAHAGTFTFDVFFGATRIRLAAWGTRNVNAYNGATNVLTLTAAQLQGATIISLLIKGNSWQLRANNGATVSGTSTIGTSAQMGDIVVEGQDLSRVAGIQVSHPEQSWQEFYSLSFRANAKLLVGASVGSSFNAYMDAGRAINEVSAKDLLGEIGSATLSAMWIDETGVLTFAPSLVLAERSPVRTVTTLDDISSLSWEDNLLGSRSRVKVVFLRPAISTSRKCNRTVYQGSAETLESTEEIVEFIEPGSEEDWVQVDESMYVLGEVSWSPYNGGENTHGGVFYSNAGSEIVDVSSLNTNVSMEKVGITKYKITQKAGVFPAGVVANTATSPTSSVLWAQNRNQPLPVIRAFGKVTWAEESLTPVTAGGVGSELVHDAGYWNSQKSGSEYVQGIAEYLASQTATPKPTITGMEIVPDPRLQLGDCITVQSNLMGVSMKALIVSIESTFDASGYSQSLSVRIIDSRKTTLTFGEFNDSTVSFAAWQELGPGSQSFAQFNVSEGT